MKKNSIRKTVKNTAMKTWDFCTTESALETIGWIAFVIGICFVSNPYGKLFFLGLARVLP